MNRRTWVAVLLLTFQPLVAAAQSSTTTTPASQPASHINAGQAPTGNRVAYPIPPALYANWRKYGPWDYKQQSFQYREYTLFNFGATGSAAGFPRDAPMALSDSSKPKQEDVDALDNAELQDRFSISSD